MVEFDKCCHQIVSVIFFIALVSGAAGYDILDPNGNITIKWDIISWSPDGYVAMVTLNNYQMYRHIMSPGWKLGWTWAGKEIIWSMLGAQSTDQGDCSKFMQPNIPHSCKKDPTIVDLHQEVPLNRQTKNCCKGGVLTSQGQDPSITTSTFQVNVGQSDHNQTSIKLPKNFTLLGPGPGYTCGPAQMVRPTDFRSLDGDRVSHAIMTWDVTCSYSQIRASKNPTCCVSMSSFYNSAITPCSDCACSCPSQHNCDMSDTKVSSVVALNTRSNIGQTLQCTKHMCPVRVHWHLKANYKEHWRVKITITNFIYGFSYPKWTLVVQHPNLNNVAQISSFEYKPLVPYLSANETRMFYGVNPYTDILPEAGGHGFVQSDILMKKNKDIFSLKQGWAFPRKIYFNGDECTMPPPEAYPSLPNSAYKNRIKLPSMIMFVSLVVLW